MLRLRATVTTSIRDRESGLPLLFKLIFDPYPYYPDGQAAPTLPFSLSPSQVGGAADFFPNSISNCVGGALSGAVEELAWGVVFMSAANAMDVGVAAMVGCFTGSGGGGGGSGPGGGAGGAASVADDLPPAAVLLQSARKFSGTKAPPTAGPNEVLYKADQAGNVTSYTVYRADGLPFKRVDLAGKPHRGKPTPHVHEFRYETDPRTGVTYAKELDDARDPRPDELP